MGRSISAIASYLEQQVSSEFVVIQQWRTQKERKKAFRKMFESLLDSEEAHS